MLIWGGSMNIPNEFKEAISDFFYDKSVDVYEAHKIVGEEMDVTIEKGDIKQNNLECNVHLISNEIAKRDYGLDIQANILVTCNTTVAKIGDYLVYNNNDYIVTGKLMPDSHTKLFAEVV